MHTSQRSFFESFFFLILIIILSPKTLALVQFFKILSRPLLKVVVTFASLSLAFATRHANFTTRVGDDDF